MQDKKIWFVKGMAEVPVSGHKKIQIRPENWGICTRESKERRNRAGKPQTPYQHLKARCASNEAGENGLLSAKCMDTAVRNLWSKLPLIFLCSKEDLQFHSCVLLCDVQGQHSKSKTKRQLKPGAGGLEAKIAAKRGIHNTQVCLWSRRGALQEGDANTNQPSLLRPHILLSLPPPGRGTAPRDRSHQAKVLSNT